MSESAKTLEDEQHPLKEDPSMAAASSGAAAASSATTSSNSDLKKVFQNAVRKNNVIHKIQVLQEEKDVVAEQTLARTSQTVAEFRERFQRSRPNSVCDPCDMVPMHDQPHQLLQLATPTGPGPSVLGARMDVDMEEHMEEEEQEQQVIGSELAGAESTVKILVDKAAATDS